MEGGMRQRCRGWLTAERGPSTAPTSTHAHSKKSEALTDRASSVLPVYRARRAAGVGLAGVDMAAPKAVDMNTPAVFDAHRLFGSGVVSVGTCDSTRGNTWSGTDGGMLCIARGDPSGGTNGGTSGDAGVDDRSQRLAGQASSSCGDGACTG
eukprot:361613-Chlamydomonas_euryale.AAC.1